MHGGISHLIWGDPRTDAAIAARELARRHGSAAGHGHSPAPRSYIRATSIAHHAVLRDGGIRCFRGRAPIASERFGYSKIGALVRATEEVAQARSAAGLAGRISTRPMEPARFYVYLLSGRDALPLRSGALARGADSGIGLQAASGAARRFSPGACTRKISRNPISRFPCSRPWFMKSAAGATTHGVEVHTMASAVDRVADNKLEGMAV